MKFNVGLVQMAVSRNPRENLARAAAKIEEAARNGAQVVCLPELFQSQYFCQREDTANFDLAEAVPGPTTEALGRVAKKAGVVVVAPLFERRAAGVYHNTAAIIDADGKIAGVYRKMHIPDDPAYYEKFYFTPGDLGFRAFDDAGRKNRDTDLLGSVVPGGSAPGGVEWRVHSFLSDGDRLASQRKGIEWRGAA